MDRPPRSPRAWGAVAAGTAVLVAGGFVLARTAAPGPARLIALDAVPASAASGDRDGGGDGGGAGAPAATAAPTDSSTTAATTTTMPPRAVPVRLAATRPGALSGTLVVVDPGHNGLNYRYTDVKRAGSLDGDGPSCNTAGSSTAAGLDEMVVNWEIGTRLATILRGLGADVVLTHPDLEGFGPCADERGAVARDLAADVFVSIHADGSASGSGFHVIHPAPRDGLDPARVAASERLAGLVRDELVVIGGRPANYVGTDGVQERGDLANLNTADRPAILAELGNLKHPLDAAMLSEAPMYDRIARSLARAVTRFLGRPADAPSLRPDLDGDGFADLLLGAPQAVTTLPADTVPVAPAPTTPADPVDPAAPTVPVGPDASPPGATNVP